MTAPLEDPELSWTLQIFLGPKHTSKKFPTYQDAATALHNTIHRLISNPIDIEDIKQTLKEGPLFGVRWSCSKASDNWRFVIVRDLDSRPYESGKTPILAGKPDTSWKI